ncbi:Swarming motility protein YbiA [Lacunisphaera limnophila]|uniref:Swarming motility protein YbiA n=1 Tax=Lacunisphaera limnophila TaxID=1838286 RepID=A0A1D8AYY3_9BACT|nr:NADAR family protein [Lacunisphaera limnophila]AOS46113.1 Swarming motility protein YbiA [Lacunisphaera limnophila]
MEPSRILFSKLRGPYRLLPNFAPTAVSIDEVLWTSVEHYYQAQKFSQLFYQDLIKKAPTAWDAAKLGRQHPDKYRSDWESIKITVMHLALRAKARQHAQVAELLLASGDAVLIEESKHDAFWGNGPDGMGQNHLGRLWMIVRDEIRGAREEVELSWPNRILFPLSEELVPSNTRIRDAMIRSLHEGRVTPKEPFLSGTYRRKITKNGYLRIPRYWLLQWDNDVKAVFKKMAIRLPAVNQVMKWRISVFPKDDDAIVALETAKYADKCDQSRGYCEWLPGCYRATITSRKGYMKLDAPVLRALLTHGNEVELMGNMSLIRLYQQGAKERQIRRGYLEMKDLLGEDKPSLYQ